MPTLLQKKTAILGLLLLLVVCVGWLCLKSMPEADRNESNISGNPPKISKKEAARSMDDFQQQLENSSSPLDARATVASLKKYLFPLPPNLTAEVVSAFLNSGKDAETQLPFKVGKGGGLETHPSLRVALLDIIADINPAAAAKMSRSLLNTPTHPDEWAIALRNVARVDTDAQASDYLRKKTEELINNPDWQAKPSVGYLEAFDVLVHTKSTKSTPLLSKLIRMEARKDLNHAAFITLDRLTQKAPRKMLTQLTSDEDLRQSHPTMVGQQIARADLRDMEQRSLVKQWLISPSRTPDEIKAFVSIFPNHSQTVSNNLLSSNNYPDGSLILKQDQATLIILDTWCEQAQMEHITPYLQQSLRRLKRFAANSPE